MKEGIIKMFGNSLLNNKVLVKLWDNEKNKWYFEIIDVKKQEKEAVISYNELLSKKNK